MAITVEPNRQDVAPAPSARPGDRGEDAALDPMVAQPRSGASLPPPKARQRIMSGKAKPLSAGGVVIVGVIAYVVAALLNSGSLLRRAETQVETAPLKGVTEAVARPIDTVAGWLRLDQPSEAVADIRATGANDDTTFDDLAVTGADSDDAVAPPAGSADAAPDGGVVPAAGPGVATAPTPTTTPPLPPGQPVLRVPTDAEPLRVYAAGDSLVGGWGQALEGLATDDTNIDVDLDYEVSTGLVRTDFYNWPGRLKEKIDELDPEVVVLGFGGNDTQQMRVDGQALPVTDPKWQAEYRRRVAAVMDYVNQGGRKLIWVGTPNHPDPARTEQLLIIDTIFREEAASRPNITYVDTWKRFAAPNGGYAAYIADANGEFRPVRATSDGFHLNFDGVNILGNEILNEINSAIAQYS